MGGRRWRGRIGILFTVLFCLLLFSFTARVAENGSRVVRVGYPVQQGFTEISEDGTYSGYTYEYLQEIARYTNWEYEFVTAEGRWMSSCPDCSPCSGTGKLICWGP